MTDRTARANHLRELIASRGFSIRGAAREIARVQKTNPESMARNFRRWTSAEPRDRAIDAAPDWVIEAVEALPTRSAPSLADELRAAVRDGHVPLALARRAAAALDHASI
jgi:hypothetical protein